MENEKLSQVENENIRLKNAVEEFSIFNEIALAISSILEVDQIVDLIIKKCVKFVKAEQAAVMLLDEAESGQMFHIMVRRADSTSDGAPCRFDTQLTGWMIKNQKPLLINDFANDERFCKVEDESLNIFSMLSVPLFSKGRMIGLLALFNKKSDDGFVLQDQRMLAIIASQVAYLPAECLKRSNRLLFQNTDPQKFAPLFYEVLDTKNNQFCYANARHDRPFFIEKGKKPVCLETAGLALSIMQNTNYQESCLLFEPGDVLFIYSDGISEAMDEKKENFGEERTANLVFENQHLLPTKLIKKIIATVQNHTGNRP